MALNELIVIGERGNRRAYLNISKEEAIAKYVKDVAFVTEGYAEDRLTEINFDTEFGVYHVWEIERPTTPQ